jgi:hypothetical protein
MHRKCPGFRAAVDFQEFSIVLQHERETRGDWIGPLINCNRPLVIPLCFGVLVSLPGQLGQKTEAVTSYSLTRQRSQFMN